MPIYVCLSSFVILFRSSRISIQNKALPRRGGPTLGLGGARALPDFKKKEKSQVMCTVYWCGRWAMCCTTCLCTYYHEVWVRKVFFLLMKVTSIAIIFLLKFQFYPYFIISMKINPSQFGISHFSFLYLIFILYF